MSERYIRSEQISLNGLMQIAPISLADLSDLPPTVPVWHASKVSAASLLGIGRISAYSAVQRGEVPTIRIGARIVVPTAALLRMLGADTASATAPAGETL